MTSTTSPRRTSSEPARAAPGARATDGRRAGPGRLALAARRSGSIAIAGSVLLLVAGVALLVVVEREGIQTLQVGDWPAPFGITMVADLFSAILVVLAGVLAVAIMLYSTATIDSGRERFAYYPLTMVLLAGVCGTFLTGDLFNLYVWFEVLLIASFVLLALGGERAQLEGALKYVALNLVASAVLLVTIGVIYGLTGTVNMADLSVRLGEVDPTASWRGWRPCCSSPSASRPRWCRSSSGCRPPITRPRWRSRRSSAGCSRRSASMPWCGCSPCSSPTRRLTSSRCCSRSPA